MPQHGNPSTVRTCHLHPAPLSRQAPGSSCKGWFGNFAQSGLKKPLIGAVWASKSHFLDKLAKFKRDEREAYRGGEENECTPLHPGEQFSCAESGQDFSYTAKQKGDKSAHSIPLKYDRTLAYNLGIFYAAKRIVSAFRNRSEVLLGSSNLYLEECRRTKKKGNNERKLGAESSRTSSTHCE
ncbi:hypothetical protein K438DRAFT_1764122 [Mycena galopus ATCC 62051]|nr:hypothetical protein K438DRAFT_1764122 [Mycena galopus ATCC 62051]